MKFINQSVVLAAVLASAVQAERHARRGDGYDYGYDAAKPEVDADQPAPEGDLSDVSVEDGVSDGPMPIPSTIVEEGVSDGPEPVPSTVVVVPVEETGAPMSNMTTADYSNTTSSTAVDEETTTLTSDSTLYVSTVCLSI